MLKLGIIGTNWITGQFVEAAHESGAYQLTTVYSRTEEKAKKFAETYGNAGTETNLSVFLSDPELDVIYIASPNSLHYQQAKEAMLNGKHVIVEKPAVSKLSEYTELMEIASQEQVFFFEAARHIHEENFQVVADLLPDKKEILGANFTFMKYSSRYDAVLAGEEPNIFSPKFSGGALMDLGVYLLYAAIGWFGVPEDSHYIAQKLPTGVDGLGTIVLRYGTFDVTMLTGKIADSFLPSEIYTKNQTIRLDAVNSISDIRLHTRDGAHDGGNLALPQKDNPMVEEARAFAKMIQTPETSATQQRYHQIVMLGKEVHAVMEKMRKEAGIVFAADE